MSRRFKRICRLFLLALALTGALLWYDAFRFEPWRPRLYRQEVCLPGLPPAFDGFKIIQLSDLHIVKLGEREQRAAQLVTEAQPDLIVLTGDYVTDDGITPGPQRWRDCTEEAVRFLQPLKAPYGKYAVMGNWDNPEVMARLDQAGAATCLDNKAIALTKGGERIWLAGTWVAKGGREEAVRRMPRGETCILLAHYPEVAREVAPLGVDLILAGHYHGGQVNFPFTGPVCGRSTPCVAGLYHVGDSLLYVSRGLGMHTAAVRFRCRAEVTVLTLRAAR